MPTESKSIAPRKATQSKERKKHDVLTKDRYLKKSMLSQYFVPEKRTSNFPFLSQLHLFSTGLKTSNMKQKGKAKQSKKALISQQLYLCVRSTHNIK